MKKTIITVFAVLAGIIIVIGIIVVGSLKKYHDENTFADIEVVTKVRALDPYEENYSVKRFSDTCIKGSVIVLEPEDYTVTVMKVEHDGQVDIRVNARGGLWAEGEEYVNGGNVTLYKGETKVFHEEVTDEEFIIEVRIDNVYYR